MESAMESNDGGALEAVRGVTGNVQATLADTLDAGASALRERLGTPNEDGVRGRLGAAGGTVANRLESGALWLRENDITDLRELIGHQLEHHPGRVALIALGLGILIGRSSKR
jgi:hypothetical protein